jgi:hypothetical protein
MSSTIAVPLTCHWPWASGAQGGHQHFVFDHSKWMHYAATIYTWLGDDRKAKEHATSTC